MFCLTYVWINGWVNNCEAGDLRRQRGQYDVNVMHMKSEWAESLLLPSVMYDGSEVRADISAMENTNT